MPSRLDPIADPTRLAVTRYLAAHPGASAPETARACGIHLNTARSHLAALQEAGLVRRTSEGGRVGRPVVRFRLVEDRIRGTSLAPVEQRLVGVLRRLGFQAETLGDRLELAECPCPAVAPHDPPAVCALIDAVVDGVLEGSGLSAGARHHDPGARRCSTALSIAPT
jgi:predicted ArsR family transcriptional regulator